ncbi:MAG TPA: hypothetical protein DEA05_00535 [Rhodobacteraceae bacterium]|nr:hypothetical protein [Paracoccaceae bacterium]
MALFRHHNRQKSERSRRVYAMFEIAYTAVSFVAGLCFTIGSILFFWKEYETQAIWLFLVGSILFMVKPTLRFAREIKLAAMGDEDDLAKRFQGE